MAGGLQVPLLTQKPSRLRQGPDRQGRPVRQHLVVHRWRQAAPSGGEEPGAHSLAPGGKSFAESVADLFLAPGGEDAPFPQILLQNQVPLGQREVPFQGPLQFTSSPGVVAPFLALALGAKGSEEPPSRPCMERSQPSVSLATLRKSSSPNTLKAPTYTRARRALS